jgi:hypothetical protein
MLWTRVGKSCAKGWQMRCIWPLVCFESAYFGIRMIESLVWLVNWSVWPVRLWDWQKLDFLKVFRHFKEIHVFLHDIDLLWESSQMDMCFLCYELVWNSFVKMANSQNWKLVHCKNIILMISNLIISVHERACLRKQVGFLYRICMKLSCWIAAFLSLFYINVVIAILNPNIHIAVYLHLHQYFCLLTNIGSQWSSSHFSGTRPRCK